LTEAQLVALGLAACGAGLWLRACVSNREELAG
jgi:hypothetical protein